MDTQEKLQQEHRTNTSKFVYFLFSITTVSIGFVIQNTQDMKFQYSGFWILSIFLLFFSLICGALYIFKTNESIGHFSMLTGWGWLNVTDMKQLKSRIKTAVCEIQKCAPPYTGSIVNAYLYDWCQKLMLDCKTKCPNQDFNYFIDAYPDEKLREHAQRFFFKPHGYENEVDAMKKWKNALFSSHKKMIWQLKLVISGFFSYFLYRLASFEYISDVWIFGIYAVGLSIIFALIRYFDSFFLLLEKLTSFLDHG